MLTPQIVELTAKLAAIIGEHVVPLIISALKNHTDEQKREISKQVYQKLQGN